MPFGCHACGSRFARKDTLGRHVRLCHRVGAAEEEGEGEEGEKEEGEDSGAKQALERALKGALKGLGMQDYEMVDEAVRRILAGEE